MNSLASTPPILKSASSTFVVSRSFASGAVRFHCVLSRPSLSLVVLLAYFFVAPAAVTSKPSVS